MIKAFKNKIDGRIVDGRFNGCVDSVDRGKMASNKIPLPVKKKYQRQITSSLNS